MPEKKPNQFARFVAVIGLIAAFLAVAATIATTTSDDGDDDDDPAKEQGQATKKGERALDRGFWRVGEGDTLVSIADETGIDITQLEELNPNIDPQTLSPGDRVQLLETVDDDSSGGGGGSSGSLDDEVPAEGSGVGDEGPTGQATETDSSFSD